MLLAQIRFSLSLSLSLSVNKSILAIFKIFEPVIFPGLESSIGCFDSEIALYCSKSCYE